MTTLSPPPPPAMPLIRASLGDLPSPKSLEIRAVGSHRHGTMRQLLHALTLRTERCAPALWLLLLGQGSVSFHLADPGSWLSLIGDSWWQIATPQSSRFLLDQDRPLLGTRRRPPHIFKSCRGRWVPHLTLSASLLVGISCGWGKQHNATTPNRKEGADPESHCPHRHYAGPSDKAPQPA